MENLNLKEENIVKGDSTNIIDVTFISRWDSHGDLESSAKYNVNTGVVFDIEPVSEDESCLIEHCTLLRELIEVNGKEISVYKSCNTQTKKDAYVTIRNIENELNEALSLEDSYIELIYDEVGEYAYINCDFGNSAGSYNDTEYYVDSKEAWNELVNLFDRYSYDIAGSY